MNVRAKLIRATPYGIGFVIGVALMIPLVLLGFHAQPGDVLNFFGALLGAAITVAGSLIVVNAVEEAKSKRERQDRRRVLDELLSDVLDAIASVRSPKSDSRFPEAIMQVANIRTLVEAVQLAQGARQWVTPDNAAMIRAFGWIGRMEVNEQQLIDGSKADRFYGKAADLNELLLKPEACVRAAQLELHK